ncbi:hypothetical protein R5R35_001536 [Gryllus longicercus]
MTFIMNGVDSKTHSLSWHMSNVALQDLPLTAKGKTTKLMNDFLKLREGSKPMPQWSPPEVREWICKEALKHNFDYEKIDLRCFHDVNGETLLNMTKDDFQKRDKGSGEFIFKIVKQHSNNKKFQRKGRRPLAINEAGHQIKRNRRKKCCSVLEFIQGLLKDPTYCPSIICWENYEKGTFRFVQNHEVAKLWGDIKGNPSMNFEKLSRAMRYHYGKNIFQSVQGKLIYAFGERATGWQTDDPNFQNSCK